MLMWRGAFSPRDAALKGPRYTHLETALVARPRWTRTRSRSAAPGWQGATTENTGSIW